MEADIYVYAPDLTVADGTVTPAKFSSSVYGLVGEIAALGSVSAGSSVRLSRADHVHPTTGLAVLASANTFTAGQTITPTTGVAATVNGVSGAVSLIVKGAVGNTANLQEWQTSAATVAQVSSAGALTLTPSSGTALTVNGVSGADVVRINVNSSETSNTVYGFSYYDNSGTRKIQVNRFGNMTISGSFTSSNTAGFSPNSASTIPLNVIGAASQTADLTQYQTSGNAVMGGRNALAQLWSGSTAPVTVATGGAISGTSSGTTATLTSASAHGLAVGDLVTIAGMTPSGYNGTYLVQTVPTTTTFTVTTSGSNLGNSTVSGTASVPAQASITARSAGTVGLVVKAAASQSANLTAWQNSGGTVICRVNEVGNLYATSFRTLSDFVVGSEENSGGRFRMTKQTAQAGSPGANNAVLYFRDGTNANTLKLVVRAGTAGAETPILDNIDQSTGAINTVTLPETIKANGNQNATFAIDAGAGTTHTVTLTGSIGTALTFSNLPSDGSVTLTLIITQDGTGGKTITWPSGTKWAGGTAPTLSTAANAVDIVTLVVNRSGGSTSAVYGFLAGKDFK